MPAVTRSQTKAKRLPIEATILNPKKNDFLFITTTNKYKDIIHCLHHGRATTKEQISFKKASINYQVNFDYTFAYDYSNGLYDSIFLGFKFIKSDNTAVSDNDKEILINLVKQYYK